MATRRKSGTTDRRNREPEIVDAAVRVFHDKGYLAASLQDVADIVGVLKGSLYHYIDSKEDLLYRICAHSHERASEIMRAAVEASDDPLEQLRTYLTDIGAWYLHNIERVSIYFNEGRWLTGERLEKVRDERREFQGFLRGLIEKAAQQGEIAPHVEPRLATHLILGSLNNVSTWYRPDGLYAPTEIVEAFTQMALASLTGESPSPRTKQPARGRARAK
ncbi:TetR/AcrR family transcriptional regulator [Saccharomonospora sp. NPDC046836]|uniref:TetR/AcrR family transcriptional regulator n=1 Tax=Saccharomonospora sp. NPDC046836 TaxID=3156921 RepID=UPI00340F4651